MNFYSNGKLLITGEYLVLEGAKSLAIPTKFGQNLIVEKIEQRQLIWGSFTHTRKCWFEAVFDLPSQPYWMVDSFEERKRVLNGL